jgi:hypothetical protein
MKKFSLFKKVVEREVTCALCLAKVKRQNSTELYNRDICKWCTDYYSRAFPKDWREQVKPMLFQATS